MTGAHQHAAGAAHRDANDDALEYGKGGFSTKIHLRCEGNGKPVTFLLTVRERNESVVFEPLMEQGAVKRTGRGRPRLQPERVARDKGYTGSPIRAYLRRAINRLKQFRRIATRYEKRAENYLAMLTLAFILIWLEVLKRVLEIMIRLPLPVLRTNNGAFSPINQHFFYFWVTGKNCSMELLGNRSENP